MKEVYLIEIDGKVSQEGYESLEDAKEFMKHKAKIMNTYTKLKPQIGMTKATYFVDTGLKGFNDPFKEKEIKILFIGIKEGKK